MSDEIRHQGRYEDYDAPATPGLRPARLTWMLRALGPIAALAVWLALGGAENLSQEARAVAAIGTLMAVW